MKKLTSLLIFILLATGYTQAQWEMQLDLQNYTYLDRIFFLNENLGWSIGCASIEGMTPYFYTTDGGGHWYIDDQWMDIMGDDIVFVNPDTGFIATQNGVIYKTTDGGQSWTGIQTPATQNVIRLFFVDENNGWATLKNQNDAFQLVHTMDGGDNWFTQQVFEINTSGLLSIYFLSDRIGFGGGGYYDIENNNEYSSIVKTINKGETWESIYLTQNTFYAIYDLFFFDTITGWAVGGKPSMQYLLMHTDNGGETWEEHTIESTYDLYSINCICFVNDSTGWIGGAVELGYGIIYFTNNSGENWHLQQMFYEPILDIQMLNSDTGWAVGGGYIYHTTNGDSIYVENVNENKLIKNLFTFFPNPTNGIITIKTPHSLTGKCQLMISGLYGDRIFHLNNITIEQLNNRTLSPL